jgi:hypothetical protein
VGAGVALKAASRASPYTTMVRVTMRAAMPRLL